MTITKDEYESYHRQCPYCKGWVAAGSADDFLLCYECEKTWKLHAGGTWFSIHIMSGDLHVLKVLDMEQIA